MERYEAFLKGDTVQQMADLAGVPRTTYQSWLRSRGLKVRRKRATKPFTHKNGTRDYSLDNILYCEKHKAQSREFVKTRPLHERERIRHFATCLLVTLEKANRKPKPGYVSLFMEEYFKIYGGKKVEGY